MNTLLYLLCTLVMSDCQSPDKAERLPNAAIANGQRLLQLETRLIDEASGMASSTVNPDILWMHNDSGNAAEIYAIHTQTGALLNTVKVDSSDAMDWEDMASYQHQGQSWLLLADTGDNRSHRQTVALLGLIEPTAQQTTATPQWRLRFQFEDGPRDCEAVAVDSANQSIWLLSKRDQPPRLYRLNLPNVSAIQANTPVSRTVSDPESQRVQTAVFMGEVDNIPAPTEQDLQEAPFFGKYRNRPTAMDISADGRQLLITTPKDSYIYRRDPPLTWPQALEQNPLLINTAQLAQTEGGAFSQSGNGLWVVSEQLPTQLFYTPLIQQNLNTTAPQ